jgi:hypothetical protein
MSVTDTATLRPSRADRWVRCPGSVMLELMYPETETSEAAQEGTAAHWVAATVLGYFEGFCASRDAHARMGKLRPDLRHWEGKTAPNGVIITEEMLEAVAVYVDIIIDRIEAVGTLGGNNYAAIEHPIFCDSIHPENKGTLDGSVVIEAAQADGTLIIYDFKYGWGIVEPSDSWQLINYAIGMLEEIHARGRPMPTKVDLRIVQPRPWHPLGHERSFVIPVAELGSRYYGTMKASAEEAFSVAPSTRTGDHCTYCSARHVCETLNRGAYSASEIIGVSLPSEMPPDAIGKQIRLLTDVCKLAEARLEGLKAQAIGIFRSGGTVNGWAIQTGQGRKKWNKDLNEVFVLGDLMGVELRKEAAITPTQAIKAGIDEAVINAYSETPVTGLKLVPDNLNKAKQVFNNG